MIALRDFLVRKQGQTICQIDELKVDAGETLAVIGANGSGKTTLLRVLADLEKDFAGHCSVLGNRFQKTYVHQHPLLFRGTVLDNVRYGLRREVDPLQLLAALGVETLAERNVVGLSGGEARRVALARALATEPKLLLVDEPFADLDAAAGERVCQLLSQLTETTIVIASPMPVPEAVGARTFAIEPTAHEEH